MSASARVAFSISLFALPVAVFAQAGPSEPQVISAASTGKINVGQRKLGGQLLATVRVGDDGKVSEVAVVENTTDDGFEPQLVKVLQNARFRPAIDENGKPMEASIDMSSAGAITNPRASR